MPEPALLASLLTIAMDEEDREWWQSQGFNVYGPFTVPPWLKLEVVGPSLQKTFMIKYSTPLRKLLQSYGAITGLDPAELQISCSGKLINAAATATTAGLMDGDVLHCFERISQGSPSLQMA